MNFLKHPNFYLLCFHEYQTFENDLLGIQEAHLWTQSSAKVNKTLRQRIQPAIYIFFLYL